MATTLFLHLEAPLQSWGERAQWSIRDTASEPTKSGIVGLLACALGWRDDEPIRTLSQSIQIGVRCDFMGASAPLVDYHTVGGGYKHPQLLTAQGKPKLSSGEPHNEQTWRSYLCDASFLVAVQSTPEDDNLIGKLADAVQSPVWPLYMGRKSCIPTKPVFAGIGNHPTLQAALESDEYPVEWRSWRTMPLTIKVRGVLECPALTENSVRRRDQITSRQYRSFAPRYSQDVLLTVKTIPFQLNTEA